MHSTLFSTHKPRCREEPTWICWSKMRNVSHIQKSKISLLMRKQVSSHVTSACSKNVSKDLCLLPLTLGKLRESLMNGMRDFSRISHAWKILPHPLYLNASKIKSRNSSKPFICRCVKLRRMCCSRSSPVPNLKIWLLWLRPWIFNLTRNCYTG